MQGILSSFSTVGVLSGNIIICVATEHSSHPFMHITRLANHLQVWAHAATTWAAGLPPWHNFFLHTYVMRASAKSFTCGPIYTYTMVQYFNVRITTRSWMLVLSVTQWGNLAHLLWSCNQQPFNLFFQFARRTILYALSLLCVNMHYFHVAVLSSCKQLQ